MISPRVSAFVSGRRRLQFALFSGASGSLGETCETSGSGIAPFSGSGSGGARATGTAPSARASVLRATRAAGAQGFTLIEVMVVIAILAAVLAVGAPRLFNTATAMRGAIRQISVMTREMRNIARLTNSTVRLVISMNEEKKVHSYWVESAPGNVTLLSADQEKALKDMTSSQRDDEKPKSEFQTESRIMKKAEQLPKGLFFESVEYASKTDPVTEGVAYVHFFPQGLAEEVAIHLTDRKSLNWTIAINPLTGRADVFERKITLKELMNQ